MIVAVIMISRPQRKVSRCKCYGYRYIYIQTPSETGVKITCHAFRLGKYNSIMTSAYGMHHIENCCEKVCGYSLQSSVEVVWHGHSAWVRVPNRFMHKMVKTNVEHFGCFTSQLRDCLQRLPPRLLHRTRYLPTRLAQLSIYTVIICALGHGEMLPMSRIVYTHANASFDWHGNTYNPLTLAVYSSFSSMFLAARSLWMKPFLERYSIASAISWQNLSSWRGSSLHTGQVLMWGTVRQSEECYL